MSIDFRRWEEKYAINYRQSNVSIQYRDEKGEIANEYSPYFESISQVLQRRGFLLKEEFISICEWKSRRQRNKYQENSEKEVKKITAAVISIHPDTEEQIQIYKLTQLNGVAVPVASALLTVIFPQNYCVLDYRAWRALLWVTSTKPFIFRGYSEFSKTMDDFRNYASLGSYMDYLVSIEKVQLLNLSDFQISHWRLGFFKANYLKKIRALAGQHHMTPRKIEMALWI